MRPSVLSEASTCARLAPLTMIAPGPNVWPSAENDSSAAAILIDGFLKRNGLAFLAAPLGRVEVALRPQARLLDDPPLSDWIDHRKRR